MIEEINLKAPGYQTHLLENLHVDRTIKELNNKALISFVESISQMVLIVNKQQEIVYANSSFHSFFDTKSVKHVLGKKPGDTFRCINSVRTKYGCGLSRFCESCGAANAILEAARGTNSTKECKIQTTKNEMIDLRVTASPLKLAKNDLTLFSITDISHEKRKTSLERIFIHDILNIAGGINGLSTILKEIDDPKEIKQITETIENASTNLIDKIQAQRELSSAERGDLTLNFTEVKSNEILKELKKLYFNYESSSNNPISIKSNENFGVVTDKNLLKRILGNMIKNAIEANVPNDHISIGCTSYKDKVCFEVHNNSVIPDEVQAKLFSRFYSTKQEGRGVGTYSMKLFGEKYLKGKVWFTSSAEDGTCFFFELKA